MTELIRREDAVKAIEDLCMDGGATAEQVWSSDILDALRNVPAVLSVAEGTTAIGYLFTISRCNSCFGKLMYGMIYCPECGRKVKRDV